MRFLVDNALSPILAGAAADDCVLLSADTDFSTILATRAASRPSLILFRGGGSRKADHLASFIVANLGEVADALDSGAIVTFEPSRVRVRALPIVFDR